MRKLKNKAKNILMHVLFRLALILSIPMNLVFLLMHIIDKKKTEELICRLIYGEIILP